MGTISLGPGGKDPNMGEPTNQLTWILGFSSGTGLGAESSFSSSTLSISSDSCKETELTSSYVQKNKNKPYDLSIERRTEDD